MFYNNRYTLLSLAILCGMFTIFSLYYGPDSVVRKGVAMVDGQNEVQIGGEFTLTDHNGNVYTHEALNGKLSLVFFGFTFCPDICPQGLSTMALVLEKMPEDLRSKVNPIFITLDPERDTAEVMQSYVTAFHPQIVGLTGDLGSIKQTAKKYLVYRAKEEPDEDGNYMISHSGYIYLMGPDGKYIKHFSHKSDDSEIVTALNKLLQK